MGEILAVGYHIIVSININKVFQMLWLCSNIEMFNLNVVDKLSQIREHH